MTDQEFVERIATKLNRAWDIPWRDEEQEQVHFETALTIVVKYVPESLRAFMVDASDGLSDAEIARHSDVLGGILVDLIPNIPQIPDFIETPILETVIPIMVGEVLRFARTGLSLDEPSPV